MKIKRPIKMNSRGYKQRREPINRREIKQAGEPACQ
jgi:hypothetical protein